MPALARAEEWLAVEQVIDGDTLRLVDGETVRLLAINAPEIDHELPANSQTGGEEARDLLEGLVANQSIRCEPDQNPRDRYGRLLAHCWRKDGLWLPQALLESGVVYVYSFPDNRSHLHELLAFEADARQEKRGLWAMPEYVPLKADKAEVAIGRFRLIEGRVTDVANVRGHTYINFGEDWKTDFTIFVHKKHRKRFDVLDLEALDGIRVRVRGWVFAKNGPMIEVDHPEQLEILNEVDVQ